MIEPQKPADVRQAAITFYTKLIQGQYRDMSIMKTHFFRLVQNNKSQSDLPYYLDMLKALTENGRDIQNFEDEIGMFLLRWMDEIIVCKLTAPYLELIVNVFKFNTAYIDREVVVGIMQRVCSEICIQFVNDRETFLQSLLFIDVVVCYVLFPNEILAPLVSVLCRAVNCEAYLDASHRTMKKLLETNLGYASLLTMIAMLSDNRYYIDAQLLRGAVFHINMNLWGGANSSLHNGVKYSSTVLSSYLKALKSNHVIVTYEILLSLQTLLGKCGKDLSEPSWDILLKILESLLTSDKYLENPEVLSRFLMIIDSIEALVQENKIGDVDMVYALIEKISHKRPVSWIIHSWLLQFDNISCFLGTVGHQTHQLQSNEDFSNAVGVA